MVGNIVVFCAPEVLWFPEVLHLAEILFGFRAQLVDGYNLPGRPGGICGHEHKISIRLSVMHHAGVDWGILLRLVAFP